MATSKKITETRQAEYQKSLDRAAAWRIRAYRMRDEGLSMATIANRMGLTESDVRTLLEP